MRLYNKKKYDFLKEESKVVKKIKYSSTNFWTNTDVI